MKKLKGIISAIVMLSLLAAIASPAFAQKDDEPIASNTDGNYLFHKITNPSAGSGEADGLNSLDELYAANRYNSYAWAMEERDGYLYVGTNRNIYGAALANIAAQMAVAQETSYEETSERVMSVVDKLTGGDIPDFTAMSQEDWIPQIIKINTETNESKVIYTTNLEGVNPQLEAASFRSVVKFNNKLYYGSLGSTRLQIVCVNEDDTCEIVYETSAKGSSLRASTVHDGTVVFGGLDSTLTPAEDSEYAGCKPIVIRAMNPDNNKDWSAIIADYRDFVPYADEVVYAGAGGTVWDLVSYNGKLYVILATDAGFALFRGEKAPQEPATVKATANEYGWIWTPVIGEGGAYNIGMAETAEGWNAGENSVLGALHSTATPYVYNGKLYIGTFDYSTNVIISTFQKLLARINDMENGPSIADIYRMMYLVMTNPQKMYVMDENEQITEVDELNTMLSGTLNDYIWRMKELDGSLYISTFDPSSLYRYVASTEKLFDIDAIQIDSETFSELLQKFNDILQGKKGMQSAEILVATEALVNAAGEFAAEKIELDAFVGVINNTKKLATIISRNPESGEVKKAAYDLISAISTDDIIGLSMLVEMNALLDNSEYGFDVYKTDDGETWETISTDGFGDEYNYGGRTFAVCNDELYIGTANPFYGAQVWKVEKYVAPQILLGDVNLDCIVNTGDAVIVLKYTTDLIVLDEIQLCAGDVNCNGAVNTGDAVMILGYTIKLNSIPGNIEDITE